MRGIDPFPSNRATASALPSAPGWTEEATAVLRRSYDFFGGEDAWLGIRTVRLFAGPLGGLLPLLKGSGRTFHFPSVIEVSPHERHTAFLDYPRTGCRGVYDAGSVRIAHGGSVLESSADHRTTFHGLAKNRFWTPLDALYFFGYALVHYHSLPFSLARHRLVRHRRTGSGSAALDVLEVELDAAEHTHCRREAFWFDASGCLVRHDYVADVVGPWARGAHYWRNVTRVNGFPVAMDRRVVPRLGGLAIPAVTVLLATFRHAEVE